MPHKIINTFYLKTCLILVFCIGLSSQVKSQTWDTLPGKIPNLNIYDFVSYHDTLVVAGNFIPWEPYFESYAVVGWDSVNWTSFSGLLDAPAQSLIVFQEELIVGGDFGIINNPDDIEKLAIWNSENWQQLGSVSWNSQTEFWHMAIYHDTLFAAGQGVYSPQNPDLSMMVRWHNGDFQGSPPYGSTCFGLCVFEDKLYSGLFSTFDLDNGEYVHGITAYDGERWGHVYDNDGNLFTPQVSSMIVDTINHDFYIAGVYVYRWDGETYHNIAALGGQVYAHAMCFYRGDLIIGGNFHSVNEQNMDFMARWNGNAWTDVAGNTSRAVEALYEYKDELYVGGYFDTVGGNIEAHGIARYYEPPVSDCHWLRPRVQTTAHKDTFYLTSDAPLAEVEFINNNAYAESWQWSLDGSPIYTSNDTVLNTYNTPGTYYASVEVTQDGCVKTAEIQIEVIDVTGISHELKEEDIGLFPNPVMNTLYIKLPVFDKSIPVVVYNQHGQELLKDKIPAGTTQHKLDVYALSSGSYIVRIGDVKRSFVVR